MNLGIAFANGASLRRYNTFVDGPLAGLSSIDGYRFLGFELYNTAIYLY